MNTYDVTYGYLTTGCCFDCVERVKAENKEEAKKLMEQFLENEGIKGQIRYVEQVDDMA